MSDYKKAYHLAHGLVNDIATANKYSCLKMTPKETVRFISVTLFLLEKLKLYNYIIDIHESFVLNEAIMT